MKSITSSFFIPTVESGLSSGAVDTWILANGVWADAGLWDDGSNWQDA